MALGRLASELFCFCFFFLCVCVCLLQNLTLDTKRKTREEEKRKRGTSRLGMPRRSVLQVARLQMPPCFLPMIPPKGRPFPPPSSFVPPPPPPPLSSVLWAGRPSPAPMARGRREGGASTPRRTMPHQGRGKHDEKKEKKRREKLVFFFFFSLLVTSRRRFAHIDEAQGTRTNAAPSTHTRERCIGPFSLSDLPRTNDDVLFFSFHFLPVSKRVEQRRQHDTYRTTTTKKKGSHKRCYKNNYMKQKKKKKKPANKQKEEQRATAITCDARKSRAPGRAAVCGCNGGRARSRSRRSRRPPCPESS